MPITINGDGTVTGANFDKGFFARQTTEHNVPNETWTKVQNLESSEITKNIGSSWANSKYTVASGQEGVYFLFGGVGIDDVQIVDQVQIKLYKNGSQATALKHLEECRFQNGTTPNLIVNTGLFGYMLDLDVGDYVELFCHHNEGSTEPTEPNRTWFGGFKI